MANLRMVVLGFAAIAGCGDGGSVCGNGTHEASGMCLPDAICEDGTVYIPETGECIPSDELCGGGTVLINGTCQDPTAGLVIDVEEAAEPNGFEPGASPAGNLELKAAGGDALVVHGCIKPVDNTEPDFDLYTLTVAGPTLVHVTADGVHGLAAAFFATGPVDHPLLSTWLRMGITLVSDTSKREVFFPAAGTYSFIVSDSRTLLPITQNAQTFPPAGNPDGTSCYYVSIATRALPTPKSLDLTQPTTTGTIGENLEFFTAAFPTGYTSLAAEVDPEDTNGDGIPDIDSKAAPALVFLNNSKLRSADQGNALDTVANAFFGGVIFGDTPIVVLDYAWNLSVFPSPYRITVEAAMSSVDLSTGGGTKTDTTHGRAFQSPGGAVDFGAINLFHIDTAAQGETLGTDLHFRTGGNPLQLSGVLADQDGFVVASFTGLAGGPDSSTTFSDYVGLLRFDQPGRYYFFLFAPRDPVGTPITIQSTFETLVPPPLAFGTDPAPIDVNAYNSNPFTYDPGLEPWQQFDATGVGTGNLAVTFYDPASAFGRLDNLVTRIGGGAGTPSNAAGEVPALFGFTFAPDGSTPAGRILRSADGTQFPGELFGKVNPTLQTGARSFDLAFAPRAYDNFGGPTIDPGTSRTATATISAAQPEQRYYFETAPRDVVTITVTPTGAPATLNAAFDLLTPNETAQRTINRSTGTGAETLRFAQGPSGFTAFRVRGATGSTGGYTVTVTVEPPFTYVASTSPTAYADACAGGTAVTLASDPSGFPADDDGLSAAITLPAGFAFFGAPVTSVRVSSNGFLTLDLANKNSLPLNQALADTAVANIAPYWDDLRNIVVCRKLVAGKLVVQWTGNLFLGNDPVEFQAILDPATDAIEFVYGPGHTANGAAATIGVQGELGATQLGFNQPVVSPGSATLLTPQ
ncbi:MAG TPA: hypothetical protein VFQ53_28175 [Kofleriaceae bacterium]|nr:hypothetical protein [Kofleriaceae bacterium]